MYGGHEAHQHPHARGALLLACLLGEGSCVYGKTGTLLKALLKETPGFICFFFKETLNGALVKENWGLMVSLSFLSRILTKNAFSCALKK